MYKNMNLLVNFFGGGLFWKLMMLFYILQLGESTALLQFKVPLTRILETELRWDCKSEEILFREFVLDLLRKSKLYKGRIKSAAKLDPGKFVNFATIRFEGSHLDPCAIITIPLSLSDVSLRKGDLEGQWREFIRLLKYPPRDIETRVRDVPDSYKMVTGGAVVLYAFKHGNSCNKKTPGRGTAGPGGMREEEPRTKGAHTGTPGRLEARNADLKTMGARNEMMISSLNLASRETETRPAEKLHQGMGQPRESIQPKFKNLSIDVHARPLHELRPEQRGTGKSPGRARERTHSDS